MRCVTPIGLSMVERARRFNGGSAEGCGAGHRRSRAQAEAEPEAETETDARTESEPGTEDESEVAVVSFDENGLPAIPESPFVRRGLVARVAAGIIASC